jgi:hypothetical protein
MDAMNSTCCLVGLLWLQRTYNLGSIIYMLFSICSKKIYTLFFRDSTLLY